MRLGVIEHGRLAPCAIPPADDADDASLSLLNRRRMGERFSAHGRRLPPDRVDARHTARRCLRQVELDADDGARHYAVRCETRAT